MSAQPSTPAGRLAPVSINWICVMGIVFTYEAPAEQLMAAGLVQPRHLPGPRRGSCSHPHEDGGVCKCSRLADGKVRLTIHADAVLNLDKPFKRFLGGLLADTRLSLVKGERHA